MNEYYFDIDPQPARRPRARAMGKKVTLYRHPSDTSFRNQIKALAKKYPYHPLSGPVRVEIDFFIKKPKTNRDKYPINRRSGDIDNHAKNILDSLNNIAYCDDSQIVSLSIGKYYSAVSSVRVKVYPFT